MGARIRTNQRYNCRYTTFLRRDEYVEMARTINRRDSWSAAVHVHVPKWVKALGCTPDGRDRIQARLSEIT